MLEALHEHLEHRLSEEEFQQTADDAVRLAFQAQLDGGVDVVTDGEQRRDHYARSQTSLPVKVALPGPYLLTRTMWMECVSDSADADREALSRDVVRVLREEIHFLLAGCIARRPAMTVQRTLALRRARGGSLRPRDGDVERCRSDHP